MSSRSLRPLHRTNSPFHNLHRPSAGAYLPIPQAPQRRNANLLKRPKRPWLMDQIIILSDGSAYKQLSTSPKGIIRSTKDVRNHPMWNPSSQKLMAVLDDEAGKLSAFRERYGRAFDSKDATTAAELSSRREASNTADDADNLMDLIRGVGQVKSRGLSRGKRDAKK